MQNYVPNGNMIYQNQAGQYVPPIPAAQNPQPYQGVQPNPNYTGVSIQIYNPMVNSDGTGYIYPQQTTSAYAPGTGGGCYPANYYTTQGYSTNGYTTGIQNPNGFYDTFGRFYPYVQDGNGQIGYYDNNGNFQTLNTPNNSTAANNGQENTIYDENGTPHKKAVGPNGEIGYYDENGTFHPAKNSSDKAEGNKENGFYDETGKYHEYTTGPNGEKGYYDEKGNFTPVNKPKSEKNSAGTDNNDNSASVNSETTSAETLESNPETESQEKLGNGNTEKRNVVILSDEYIKTLENYLNSQDLEIRKMGARDVIARLEEDPSRKDDPALTALVNKMLQDPSSTIRALGLSTIEAGVLSGDNKTVDLLKKIQKKDDGYGLDATQATSALLKMAAKTEEKEFEIKNSNNVKAEKE